MTREEVHQKALAMLNRRALSSGMLLSRLKKHGAEERDAREVITGLTEVGLVDDDEYARMLIRRTLLRGSAGPRYIRRLLMKDMLGREVIERALAEFNTQRDQLADAREFADKKLKLLSGVDPVAARRRLYGQLARRGFDPDICTAVVSRIFSAE